MASAEELATRALEMAERFLGSSTDEIAGLAGSDTQVLYDASQLVRQHAEAGAHATHSAEHLAFSLLTAAHERIRLRGARRP